MSRWSHWYPHLIAAGALLMGCAIYLTARPASLFYVGGGLAAPLTGPLPSFLHTLSFALVGSLLMGRRNIAMAAILVWGALETVAELAQHDIFPVPSVLGAYQQASTFDWIDLVSIQAAVAVALLINYTMRCR